MTNENKTEFNIEGWKNIKPWHVHNGHCGIGHTCYTLIPIIYDDALSLYENVCKAFQYISDLNNNLEAMKAYLAGLQAQIMQWIKEGVADELAKQLPPLLAEINQRIDDLETKIETVKTDLEEAIETTNENVLKNTQSILNLEENITTITNQISQLYQYITSISSQISQIEQDINTINGKITQVEQELQEISGSTADIEADLTLIKTDIAGLKTDVSENTANIDSLLSTVGNINDSIDDIMDDIITINNRLTQLEQAGYVTNSDLKNFIESNLAFEYTRNDVAMWEIGGTFHTSIHTSDVENALGICFGFSLNPSDLLKSPPVNPTPIYPIPSKYSETYYNLLTNKMFNTTESSPLDWLTFDFSIVFNTDIEVFDLKMGKTWEIGANNAAGTASSSVTANKARSMRYVAIYVVKPKILTTT